MIKILGAVTAVMAFSATAALALTITGNADAIIKKALSSTENTHLNYATIQAPATGGAVTLSPAGAISTAASGFTFSGTPTAGNFTITGDANTSLTVTPGAGSLTGPGTAMNLSNFTTTPAAGSITTNGSGTLTLNVGADLAVGSNQTSGTYAGTYTLTVSY